MARAARVAGTHRIVFECPGCGMAHCISDAPGRWTFNGEFERPTFAPSVLVRWTYGPRREPRVCHSFVREGRIEFLGDCTHELAGKTVELPDEL